MTYFNLERSKKVCWEYEDNLIQVAGNWSKSTSQGVTLHLSVINRFPFFFSFHFSAYSFSGPCSPPTSRLTFFVHCSFFFVLLSCCLPSLLEWWQPAVTTTPALLTTEQTRQQHWWHCPLNVSLWAVLGPILDANFFLFSFIYSLDSCSCFFSVYSSECQTCPLLFFLTYIFYSLLIQSQIGGEIRLFSPWCLLGTLRQTII